MNPNSASATEAVPQRYVSTSHGDNPAFSSDTVKNGARPNVADDSAA